MNSVSLGWGPKYGSVLPAVAVFLALAVLPVANLFFLSFMEISWTGGVMQREFVGTENYRALADDPLLKAGIVNTLILVVVATSCQVALGLALALGCSSLGTSSRTYRTLFILPILIPGIIIGAIWRLMYNFQFGIINQALDVAEAAKVDGATAWQEFRRVSLPLLWPAIFTTFVFRAVIAFKVFDEIFLLTSGGPGTATEVISFTIYQRFFLQDNPGYGSAISVTVIFSVALVIAIALQFRSRQDVAR